MIPPAGHHLAALNWGRLRHGWDDPRTAPFAEALDAVYAVAQRSPGYLWHMPEEQMEAEQCGPGGAFGGDPLVASTLSLWRDPQSFIDFTLHSIHARFMARAGEWFRDGESGMVLWWQAEGSYPQVTDGLARHAHMLRHGPGAEGFSWATLGVERGVNPRHAKG